MGEPMRIRIFSLPGEKTKRFPPRPEKLRISTPTRDLGFFPVFSLGEGAVTALGRDPAGAAGKCGACHLANRKRRRRQMLGDLAELHEASATFDQPAHNCSKRI